MAARLLQLIVVISLSSVDVGALLAWYSALHRVTGWDASGLAAHHLRILELVHGEVGGALVIDGRVRTQKGGGVSLQID